MDVYDRETIESRHEIEFEETPTPIKGQKYYDGTGWIKVKIMNYLPYGLATYQFCDDNTKCIVTCEDSYRLSNQYRRIPTDDFMREERLWRNTIVKPNVKLEYKIPLGSYKKAKVYICKSDIIPGVILIGPEDSKDIDVYGYIYKESVRLFKSGSYCD